MQFLMIPLLVLSLVTSTLTTPIPAVSAPLSITCYGTDRGGMPQAIEGLMTMYEDDERILDYPWELMNFGAVLRANGDTKVKVSTAVREAREYIIANCEGADESENYGGLADMGSHRVRIALPGK